MSVQPGFCSFQQPKSLVERLRLDVLPEVVRAVMKGKGLVEPPVHQVQLHPVEEVSAPVLTRALLSCSARTCAAKRRRC